jgi:Sad1 / UNC-like C-terminal
MDTFCDFWLKPSHLVKSRTIVSSVLSAFVQVLTMWIGPLFLGCVSTLLLCNVPWIEVTCTLQVHWGIPSEILPICEAQAFFSGLGLQYLLPHSAHHLHPYNHYLDMIGRRDFALYSAGADIVPSLTSPVPSLPPTFRSRMSKWMWGYDLSFSRTNPPTIALDPDINVGSCWEIPGSAGHLGISLVEDANISAITLDHCPAPLASLAQMQQAPRGLVVWGLLTLPVDMLSVNNQPFPPRLCNSTCFHPAITNPTTSASPSDYFVQLAEASYNVSAPFHIQTFPVDEYLRGTSFRTLVLQIISNWGANTTCLYRVRVHGEPVVN